MILFKLLFEVLQSRRNRFDRLFSPRGVLLKQILLTSTPNLHFLAPTGRCRRHGHLNRILIRAFLYNLATRKDGLDALGRGAKLLVASVSVTALRVFVMWIQRAWVRIVLRRFYGEPGNGRGSNKHDYPVRVRRLADPLLKSQRVQTAFEATYIGDGKAGRRAHGAESFWVGLHKTDNRIVTTFVVLMTCVTNIKVGLTISKTIQNVELYE